MTNSTKAQMDRIAEDYRQLLSPSWHVSDGVLARIDGPILQAISFQVLRTGEYRPMNGIRVLVAPDPDQGSRGGPDFFAQVPEGSPITVPLGKHQELHPKMFATIVREFNPSIGYRALAESGATITWGSVEAIETQALIRSGMEAGMARATVQQAIQALKDSGVSGPTRIPWGG